MCSYYKTIHESTGSIKYIRTSSSGCKVIVLGGPVSRLETSENPYPMDSGEPFEPINAREFASAEKQYTETKQPVHP